MISIDKLSMSYHGHPLFEDVSFILQEKEKCGLVGRNGSGKTTLFRLLLKQETADARRIVIKKNYTLGTLDQHIKFAQPTLLAEAALGLRPEHKDHIYQAEAILFGLGFKKEDMERSPQDFSGGYQLRLHLAKVLIAEPDCFLLDEPTNYLDIVSLRWFARFLHQWKGEFILITHDREFMDSVTTHTMGIYRQKVRKIKGPTVSFFEQTLQDEEIHERTRVNVDKKRAHAQSFIERFGAKATKAAQAQSRKKQLDKIPVLEKLKEIYSLSFNFLEAPFASKRMLEMQSVAFAYESHHPLIENMSLVVEKGERIAIIGKNGRGKSTLLRLLSRELAPHAGIFKASENLSIGYFGQTNINRLHPQHTIEEEISLANPHLSQTEVKAICGVMMFSGSKAEKKNSVLSGGERSRVLLGKIIAMPCNLLLLDEPTHHLDMESVEALIDALEEFDGAVVIVTHSELILKRIALDKIVVCRSGKQELFLGNYSEFLEKDGWHEEIDADKAKKKSGSQREVKQHRAELITARSKAVKPLDIDIVKHETLLARLEQEQSLAHEQLITATQERKSSAIQELGKAVAARAKHIDDLYGSLDTLLTKRDLLHAEFTKQLDQMEN